MKQFLVTFEDNSRDFPKVEIKTAIVNATDEKAAASQASLQHICHFTQILKIEQL